MCAVLESLRTLRHQAGQLQSPCWTECQMQKLQLSSWVKTHTRAIRGGGFGHLGLLVPLTPHLYLPFSWGRGQCWLLWFLCRVTRAGGVRTTGLQRRQHDTGWWCRSTRCFKMDYSVTRLHVNTHSTSICKELIKSTSVLTVHPSCHTAGINPQSKFLENPLRLLITEATIVATRHPFLSSRPWERRGTNTGPHCIPTRRICLILCLETIQFFLKKIKPYVLWTWALESGRLEFKP